MNSKSFLLDYGLPGLVALGAGIVTYMLTGGPEEFSDNNENNDLDSGDLMVGDDSNELEDELICDKKLSSMPPDWAKEVRTVFFF